MLLVTSVISLPLAVTVDVASWARRLALAPVLARVKLQEAICKSLLVMSWLVVSPVRMLVLPEFWIWKAVVELAEFWNNTPLVAPKARLLVVVL